jgi:TolA-binding protein
MSRARVIKYLAVLMVLGVTAACGTFPGFRTEMPPVPAENPPGTVAQPPASTANLARQVQNLQMRVQQLESQVAALEAHRPAPAYAKPKPKAVPAPAPATAMRPRPAPKPAVSRAEAEKHFTAGMRLYHEKKYAAARTQLYNYLKLDHRGPKAPEARYYLADTFYQEAKYRQAAVEFNKLRLQFPKSILAPAGLLRQAICYRNLKRQSAYRDTLTKLVRSYPHSPEATEARKLLRGGARITSR